MIGGCQDCLQHPRWVDELQYQNFLLAPPPTVNPHSISEFTVHFMYTSFPQIHPDTQCTFDYVRKTKQKLVLQSLVHIYAHSSHLMHIYAHSSPSLMHIYAHSNIHFTDLFRKGNK